MKGGLCCALFAAKAIRDAGVTLKGKLMIESVIGEEDGGIGTLAVVVRGYKADAAVIMEPTELMIAPADAGALNFRITVPGLAAHGAVRTEGVNPIDPFITIYQALMRFGTTRNQQAKHPMFEAYPIPYPICIGTLQSGIWASTVPESLTFEGRYGIAEGEDISSARKAFEAVVEAVAQSDEWLRQHPPIVEWWGWTVRTSKHPQRSPDCGNGWGGIQRDYGRRTDLSRNAIRGGYAPIGQQWGYAYLDVRAGNVRKAHQPDEYVPVSDLEVVVRTLALTALRFCGYEE